MKQNIKTYTYEDIISLMKTLKQPKFRADQLVSWMYKQGVSSFSDMLNIPEALRLKLEETHSLNTVVIIDRQVSQDGTRKYLLQYPDGARIETVAIPSGGPNKRLTVCVSTQVGCSMRCAFCATGKEGFSRNLLPGEIVDQVLLAQNDMGVRVSNIVTMGQGEPFLNYDYTIAALRFLNSPLGLSVGARHITISTCGILPSLEKFSWEPEQFTLAVSLHSAQQKTRDYLMPGLQSAPLTELKKALLNYVERTNRRVSLEYLLLEGVNDSDKALRSLLDFCKDLLCHVNLLTMNKVEGSNFKASQSARMNSWLNTLKDAHIPTSRRDSRGSDIAGACGQLKNTF